MSLRLRIDALEKAGALSERYAPRDIFREQAEHLAYLAGEGSRPPDPPCPAGQDPAFHARRRRIARCLDYRFTGELPGDGYVKGMGEDETAYVDGLWAEYRKWYGEERPGEADESSP
jgi:hypothetical protein